MVRSAAEMVIERILTGKAMYATMFMLLALSEGNRQKELLNPKP